MVVDITNLTDGPGKTPTQVAIYNVTLDPGAVVRLPAELVDAKVKSLEERGLVSIGALPGWYSAARSKKGKVLSPEEQAKRTVKPQPVKVGKPNVITLALEDKVSPPADEIEIKRNKIAREK
jgi:hypothetical protein